MSAELEAAVADARRLLEQDERGDRVFLVPPPAVSWYGWVRADPANLRTVVEVIEGPPLYR